MGKVSFMKNRDKIYSTHKHTFDLDKLLLLFQMSHIFSFVQIFAPKRLIVYTGFKCSV